MITLFVVPNCPLCASAQEVLKRHGIDFTELDVSTNYAALRRMYKLTRQKFVPVLERNGLALVRPSEADLVTFCQS